MKRAYYLALGSNLGERLQYLQAAVQALAARGVAVLRCSSVYETSPVGAAEPQPDYLNAVVECEAACAPVEMLAIAQAIEQEQQRSRGARNAARTLDIDILLAGEYTSTDRALTVPHARLHERLFVLTPLRELAPALVHPVLRRSISALYDACRAASTECVRLCAPPFVLCPSGTTD